MSILIVGSVALDSVETRAAKAEDMLGGAATYASIAASLFHDGVSLVAVVGQDFPEEHIETLRGRGVGLEGLQVAEGKTFRWGGRYHDDLKGRETLFTELNVFANFAPQVTGRAAEAEHVLLANIQPQLQLSVLEQVKAPKMVFLDTMNLWIDIARPELLEVIRRSDVFFLNDEEACQLTGCHSIHTAGERLLEMGPSHVVIKKGEHGANLYHEGGLFQCAAFPVAEVVDPTGAGDTFAGACIGCLAASPDTGPEAMRRAIAYGTTLGAFCVEDMGTTGLLRAEPDSVRERYGTLRRSMEIPVP